MERIWSRDPSVWNGDRELIAERLGWLTLPRWAMAQVHDLRRFAESVFRDGFSDVLLLGIGGATLGAEVIRDSITPGPRGLRLHILDSTHPSEIRAAARRLNLDRTLIIASSKSGTTIETRTLLDYFLARSGDPGRCVAITDEGSDLATFARERAFRRVFVDPPCVGGRFSPLSYFGLVPAALRDVDLGALVESAAGMSARCAPGGEADDNPGAVLGTALGAAWLSGRPFARVRIEGQLSPFTAWVEQMIAESTGKNGRGIVPLVYGGRELVPAGDPHLQVSVEAGRKQSLDGFGSVTLRFGGAPSAAGSEFFRWQFAIAIAGFWLGVNPFDQPDVQDSKDRTGAMLRNGLQVAPRLSVSEALAAIRDDDYVALNAFLPREPAIVARMEQVRREIESTFAVPTLLSFGPRFLHSTGQIQKGGPSSVVAIQVVDDAGLDLAIPGAAFGFAQLTRAKADADVASFLARGRRVARATISELEDEVRFPAVPATSPAPARS